MHTPQTIVIIGAGYAGMCIARGLAGGNDKVILCDESFGLAGRTTDELKRDYPAYDIEAMECFFNAAWEADIIILTLSCAAFAEVAEKIKEVANQKIVVVTDLEPEQLQVFLPNSKLVQAFTEIIPGLQQGPGAKIPCKIKGDHAEALSSVAALAEQVGFAPVILPPSGKATQSGIAHN